MARGGLIIRLKTWGDEPLLFNDLNAEYNNILNNLDPSKLGSWFNSTAEMQIVSDPNPAGNPTVAASLLIWMEQIHFVLKKMHGQSQWYLATAAMAQNGINNYAADTGIADAYVATLSPVPDFTGTIALLWSTTILHANVTPTPTANLNSRGGHTIKRADGSALVAGDLPLNWKPLFLYDGTTHFLLNPYTVMAGQIANGAVGSSQIANGAVGATQIANGGVGTAQIANGAVDSTKASSLFGAWDNTKAVNTVYGPAATDLIILASASSIGLGAAYLYVKSDTSNPPTSIVGQSNITGLANGPLNPPGFCKKGHYWKAEISGANTQGLWVIPLGS